MSMMNMDGYLALNQLFQLKANTSNTVAVDAAQAGREQSKEMKKLRDGLRSLEEKARQNSGEDAAVITTEERDALSRIMSANGVSGSELWTLQRDERGDMILGTEGVGARNANVIDTLRTRLEDGIKDLEAADKMGNFELQDNMATLNQNHTLASTTLKELTNIRLDTIRRIGG